MTKAELTKEANKAIKTMESNGQKGWKRLIKSSKMMTKKRVIDECYGGIKKGTFVIYISKNPKTTVYTAFVHEDNLNEGSIGRISSEIVVPSNSCPYNLFKEQVDKIKKQRKLLKSYIDSVK